MKKFDKVSYINGEKIKMRSLAGEHKKVLSSFYGYAFFETESGNCFYIPVDMKRNLVERTDIWDFITELPEIF